MSQVVHRRRVGDLRTVLPVTLQQPDATGLLQPVDLTGLTVTFQYGRCSDGDDEGCGNVNRRVNRVCCGRHGELRFQLGWSGHGRHLLGHVSRHAER
ncbi:MAG UNVERIFIED_CONTAM: hypothetical protein LVR18_27500 [Planctomycetaceae bacterium]